MELGAEWITSRGVVTGWFGDRDVRLEVARDVAGLWTLNDQPQSGLDGCLDLDLGFTPATNLSQLRRLKLRVGNAVNVQVAWLDVSSSGLTTLDHRYERRASDRYAYEARRFAYAAELTVDTAGFVTSYPGLWEVE